MPAVPHRCCTGIYISVIEQRIEHRSYINDLSSVYVVYTAAALGTSLGLGCMALGTEMLIAWQSILNLAAAAMGSY